MNVVLFGIQGSGKGTQATIMAKRYNLVTFATGDECRKLATLNTELGKKVKEIIASGKLVPAEVLIEVLEKFLSQTPAEQGVIFDGYPRNIEQQKDFEQTMKKWHRDFIALNIQLPPEETIHRLLARGRSDDVPEVITTRIKIFVRDTTPMIEYYRSLNKIIDIDGHQEIESVAKEISTKLDPILLKPENHQVVA